MLCLVFLKKLAVRERLESARRPRLDAYYGHGAESILKTRDISSAGAWVAPRVHRARVPAAIFMAIDKNVLRRN